MMSDMTKIMKEAIDEVSALPESDQETIGRQLLSHMEKLRRLRVEIDDERIAALAQGTGLDPAFGRGERVVGEAHEDAPDEIHHENPCAGPGLDNRRAAAGRALADARRGTGA